MLNKLNKHSGYVTHEELRNVLKYLEKIKKGDPGKDAVVSSAVIKQIKSMVKPIKNVDYKDGESYVLTEDDKIQIANYSMDRVKEHVLTDVISQDALVNLIRRQRGKDGLYVDNVRGLKKHINNILVNNQSINTVNEQVMEYGESLHQLSDHVSQLEINIAAGGRGDSDGVLTGAEIVGTDLVLTTTRNGTDTLITVDLSSLTLPEPTCAMGQPTEAGYEGEVRFDSSTNIKYEFLCGNWYESLLTPVVTPVEQECDILVDEDGNVVVDEDGNPIMINCTDAVPEEGTVLVVEDNTTLVDENNNVIVI